MDALDREILALLQEDGRMSLTDLANRVGLTLSPCHRRVRDLEESGAIRGYRAVVAPESVGLNFETIVFVTMARTDSKTITDFEQAVAGIPNIVQAERLFGDPDYMLRVLAPNLASYHEVFDGKLGELPGVQQMRSTLVMKQLVANPAVPV
jgi:DNA-binding Lrp family transcriptional regulator